MSQNANAQDLAHTQEALAFLGECFKNKANISAVLSAYIDQIQDIEDMLWAIIAAYKLDDAVGVQLDDLGSKVNESRLSRSDDAYRLAIRVQIRALRSHGHDADLIDVAALMGYAFSYTEQWPAGFEIDQYGVLNEFVVWAYSKFHQAKSAGTGFTYVYSLETQANTFIWNSTTGPDNLGKGWGDSVAGLVGGKFGSVI